MMRACRSGSRTAPSQRCLWDHPLFGRQVREAHGYYPVRSCTMLESFSEGINVSHALKALTALPEPEGFSHRMRELTDLQAAMLGRPPTEFEKNSIRFNVFDQTDPEVVAYACEDAVYALLHHLNRWPRVRKTFIYRIEMSVLPIVCAMADVGIQYDWALLRAKSAEVREFADRMLSEVIRDFEEYAGEKLKPDFNFNSNKQFADLLYSKCKMPVLHRTPGGAPSVDAKNALPGLAKKYPVVQKYMDWKRLHDLRLKFLDIYEGKYCWAADLRAHPLLNQHGTIAGRFSCEAPNYQQSPGYYFYELSDGTAFEFNFRDAIVATGPGFRPWWELVLEEAGCTDLAAPDELGYYILGFDYSQIELRVMAAEAGETRLLDGFARGEDVHKRTAALMLGIMVEQVTKKFRAIGKTFNFATIYGQGVKAKAEQLGISEDDAKEKDARYNALYPRVKPYRSGVIAKARRNGYVITKFGRRVTLHKIWDQSGKVRAAEERTAGNAVIQGPATGEYVKVAMVRAVKALAAAGLDDRVRLVMNIHDALEFECRKDVVPADVMAVLQPAVVYPITGPGKPWPEMVAEWHLGRSWGQVKEIHIEDGWVVAGKQDDCLRCRPATPEPAPHPEGPAALPPSSPVTPPPALPPAGPPREVIILLPETPLRSQVAALAEYMKSLPGPNKVELVLPGEVTVPVGFTCGLTPAHEAQVSVLLGMSAMLHYTAGSVDTGTLVSGLQL
jgi:DNA polymerase I-like protein with 3'-5' exonuclease and polymerase domains